MKPGKILVIRFSSIGDLILISPVLRCLYQQMKAEIHLLVKEKFLFIHECSPYVSRQITLRKGIRQNVEIIKSENYDAIVDLQNNRTSRILTIFSGKPTYRLNKMNIRKFLTVLTKQKFFLPKIHVVDRMFQTIQPLGCRNDGKGLEYFIPEEWKKKADSIKLPDEYVALVSGGSYGTKQIPLSVLEKIVTRNPDKNFVFLGDGSDYEQTKNIRHPNVINLCGKLHFHESVRIVEKSSCVITSDTGLMHAAAACKKKIFSLWGNTIPEFGMYPYMAADGSRCLEVKGLWCRPCSKLGFSKCPAGHFHCMKRQDVDSILF